MSSRTFFKNACRIHTDMLVHRYLLSCSEKHGNGVLKATVHAELCAFYVAVFRDMDDLDAVRRHHESDYQAVRTATANDLTDCLEDKIGFPIRGRPDYHSLAPVFFDRFHEIAVATMQEIIGKPVAN